MIISELVAALEAIWAEHGDLIVMHHDDCAEFLVEQVTFQPAEHERHRDDSWTTPAHVLLTGEVRDFDGDGGLREPETPLVLPLGVSRNIYSWIQLTPGSLTAEGLLVDPMARAMVAAEQEARAEGIQKHTEDWRERMASVKAFLEDFVAKRKGTL